MKALIFVILLIVLTGILSSFTPWWNVAVVGIILGYGFNFSNIKTFWLAFGSILLFWMVYIFYLDGLNDSLLSNRLSELLGLNSNKITILISSLMGAIVAGFAGATGSSLRKLLSKKSVLVEDNIDLKDLKDLRPEWKDTEHL